MRPQPSFSWRPTAHRGRDDWEGIKGRVDLARVVTALLGPPARRQGRRLLWLCPFHNDRHPSFEVDPRRGTWKCWPCSVGGDAPALVMRLSRVGFPQAVHLVAELSGIPVISGRSAGRITNPAAAVALDPGSTAGPAVERSSRLPRAGALALVDEAAGRLWSFAGAVARSYLKGRGLSDPTIRAARLGVVERVAIPTRDAGRSFPARGVMIPWFDEDRLALVKIRQPEGTRPKYVEVFRDRPSIFPGPRAIERGRPVVIVEGEFDALLLGQELRGLAAVVTLGSASRRPGGDDFVDLMPAAPWYLALDRDRAGDRAAAGWPARAIRVRPPGESKDWTEAAQAGVDLRRWWSDRLAEGGMMSSRPERSRSGEEAR
jgi:DNA primase